MVRKTYLYDSVIQLQAWLQCYCTNAARLLQFCCTAFAVLLHKPRSTAAKAVQQTCRGEAEKPPRQGSPPVAQSVPSGQVRSAQGGREESGRLPLGYCSWARYLCAIFTSKKRSLESKAFFRFAAVQTGSRLCRRHSGLRRDKAVAKMPVAGRDAVAESRRKTIGHAARRSNVRFGLNGPPLCLKSRSGSLGIRSQNSRTCCYGVHPMWPVVPHFTSRAGSRRRPVRPALPRCAAAGCTWPCGRSGSASRSLSARCWWPRRCRQWWHPPSRPSGAK